MGLNTVGREIADSLSAKNGINGAVVDASSQKVEEFADLTIFQYCAQF